MEIVGGVLAATAGGVIFYSCLRDRSKEYDEHALTVLFCEIERTAHTDVAPDRMRQLIRRRKVSELSLSSRGLRCFPTLGCALQGLTSVNLENNNLSGLPTEFGKLRSLKNLKLGNNRIVDLPEEVEKLIHLENFELFSNCIEKLLVNFSGMKKLKCLDLRFNPLRRIDDSISSLVCLASMNPQDRGKGLKLDNPKIAPDDFRYLQEVICSRISQLERAVSWAEHYKGYDSHERKENDRVLSALYDDVWGGRLPNSIQNPYLHAKLAGNF